MSCRECTRWRLRELFVWRFGIFQVVLEQKRCPLPFSTRPTYVQGTLHRMFYAPLGEGNHNEWQMRREDTLIMLISIAPKRKNVHFWARAPCVCSVEGARAARNRATLRPCGPEECRASPCSARANPRGSLRFTHPPRLRNGLVITRWLLRRTSSSRTWPNCQHQVPTRTAATPRAIVATFRARRLRHRSLDHA